MPGYVDLARRDRNPHENRGGILTLARLGYVRLSLSLPENTGWKSIADVPILELLPMSWHMVVFVFSRWRILVGWFWDFKHVLHQCAAWPKTFVWELGEVKLQAQLFQDVMHYLTYRAYFDGM